MGIFPLRVQIPCGPLGDNLPYKDKEKQRRYQKAYRKKYYVENRDKEIERNQNNKQKKREWFSKYKSTLECELCSENNPVCLDFHHPDRDLKNNDISKMVHDNYSIEKILIEIKKCQVLCANCHRKIEAIVV